jgi:hypothetical protein
MMSGKVYKKTGIGREEIPVAKLARGGATFVRRGARAGKSPEDRPIPG